MRTFVLTAVAATALIAAGNAGAQQRIPHRPWASMTTMQQANWYHRQIQHDRGAIRWLTRHLVVAGPPRFLEATPLLGHPRWQLQLHWFARSLHVTTAHLKQLRARLAMTLPDTNDWLTAIHVIQRVYPGSYTWLYSCSGSEGGHGIWVWRGGAPYQSYDPDTQAPGGWLQYFPGTFWGDYHRALTDLASRGYRVPPSSASWTSALGQAIAGGWAYGHDRPYGKWTGAAC